MRPSLKANEETAVLDEIAKWINDNQGVVTVLIFLVTLFLGWVWRLCVATKETKTET